ADAASGARVGAGTRPRGRAPRRAGRRRHRPAHPGVHAYAPHARVRARGPGGGGARGRRADAAAVGARGAEPGRALRVQRRGYRAAGGGASRGAARGPHESRHQRGGRHARRRPLHAHAAGRRIAEDEPEVQAVLADMLREAGYVVTVAKDGSNGLDRCEEEPIDIVLSDISMPGLSGWEVAARVRARFPTIPIGFVTGWGDQLDPERLAGTGVSFVIAKPFQTLDVLRHVAQALTTAQPGRA